MGGNLSAFTDQLVKRTLIQTLLRHRSWSLAKIDEFIAGSDPLAAAMGQLTVGELWSTDLPEIDESRRKRAEQLEGPKFDAIVLEIIAESPKPLVSAGYVRKRAGGPRWKLQAAFKRLVEAGEIERTGVTADTRYCKRGRS